MQICYKPSLRRLTCANSEKTILAVEPPSNEELAQVSLLEGY